MHLRAASCDTRRIARQGLTALARLSSQFKGLDRVPTRTGLRFSRPRARTEPEYDKWPLRSPRSVSLNLSRIRVAAVCFGGHRLRCLEPPQQPRVRYRTAWALHCECHGRQAMSLTAPAHEEVFAQGEEASARATHTVVPGVAFEFPCRDRDGGHCALISGESTARLGMQGKHGDLTASLRARLSWRASPARMTLGTTDRTLSPPTIRPQ